MAEASAVAFGRYLRQLRERRGLSLGRVCELTQPTPEPIDKGTLSRMEHGQQTPSIYRLGPLSRIYGISADALLERMELDREVDKLGSLDTQGLSYEELHRRGADATFHARKWEIYAYFRDALIVAPAEKRITATLNFATGIRSLGKNSLALHELQELEISGDLDLGQSAIVHERLSNCCRCVGDMKGAERYAEAAVEKSMRLGDPRALAYAYSARATIAIDLEQWNRAYGDLMKALAARRESQEKQSIFAESPTFEVYALLQLAECSVRLGNLARGRRLTQSALALSEKHDVDLGRAYSELILGWVDEASGRTERALARWRKAATLATRIDYQRIVFTAEVEIFRQALEVGDKARARASRRRLERLAPWIPRHIPAVRLFKQLIDHGGGSDDQRSQDEASRLGTGSVRSISGARGRCVSDRAGRSAAERPAQGYVQSDDLGEPGA